MKTKFRVWTADWSRSQWILIGLLLIGILICLAVLARPVWQIGLTRTPSQSPDPRDQVIQATREQLALNPDNYLLQAQLAEAYLHKARLSGQNAWYLLAEQQAQKSLQQASQNNGPAFLVLAAVAMAQHQFENAETWLEKAARDATVLPNVRAASFDLALAQGHLKDAQQILRAMQSALKQPIFRINKGRPYALSDSEKQAYQADAQVRAGLLAQTQGQFKQAEVAYAQARPLLQASSKDLQAWFYHLLALLKLEQGEFVAAETYLHLVLDLLPTYLPAHLSQLDLLWQQSRWQDLLEQARRLNQQEQHPVIFLRQAQAEQALGEANTATISSGLAQLTNASATGHVRDQIQLLLLRGEAVDLTLAKELVQQEQALRQDLVTGLLATELSFRLKQWPEMAKALQSLAPFGKHASILYWQARLAEAQQKPEQAAEYYRQALAINLYFHPLWAAQAQHFLKVSL